MGPVVRRHLRDLVEHGLQTIGLPCALLALGPQLGRAFHIAARSCTVKPSDCPFVSVAGVSEIPFSVSAAERDAGLESGR